MKELLKTGFFEEAPGQRSWLRMVLFIYFIVVAVPINFMVALSSIELLKNGSMDWQEMSFTLGLFLIINALWIAPKAVQKALEDEKVISKIIDSVGKGDK